MFTKKTKKPDKKKHTKNKPSLKMIFFQPSNGETAANPSGFPAIQATDLKYGSTSVVQQLILSQKVMM